MSTDPFYTYGPPQLCVWKVAPGTFWFQTTDPRYSRKLDQRQDTRRVAITGVNRYRRTYEMRGNWRKVRRIVNRYLMLTGDTFSGRLLGQDASKIVPRVGGKDSGQQERREPLGGLQMIGPSVTVMNRWLSRDFELIGAVADMGSSLVDLWEASPVRLNSNEPNTDKVIDLLFPGNPLLCCGWTRHRFDTRPRTQWYKLQDLRFIVPSPMMARQGLTRERKLSAHALSNTGPRRFLIVEFDFDASNSNEEARLLERFAAEGRDVRDLCAALLLNLAEKAPLALAVHSGGKSMHGWFYCADVPEEKSCVFPITLSR